MAQVNGAVDDVAPKVVESVIICALVPLAKRTPPGYRFGGELSRIDTEPMIELPPSTPSVLAATGSVKAINPAIDEVEPRVKASRKVTLFPC